VGVVLWVVWWCGVGCVGWGGFLCFWWCVVFLWLGWCGWVLGGGGGGGGGGFFFVFFLFFG
ncbi:hypothetical protein PUR71_05925, partial [Streptomyces sp. SP17BM10]|uniref:hypothetical protein n=1 Tax=Streptomyces sp. SP17BM10 TaxID=3002530 RepID=UPI002E75C2FC